MKITPNKAIKCIILDDELAAHKVLKHFIAETNHLTLVAAFQNPNEAMEYLNENPVVDVIFLDIHMPSMNGMQFYKGLTNPPAVIFTTAYPEYAVEGFEVNAIDYLVKPIPFERFVSAVNKLFISKERTMEHDSYLSIKENKTIHKVNTNEIVYAEAYGDYVKVFTSENVIVTLSTFNDFIGKLPKEFIRIHKSYCVNQTFINKISGNKLTVGTVELPIGLTYKEKVWVLF